MNRRLQILGVLCAAVGMADWPMQAGKLAGPFTNPENGHLYYILTEDTWQNSEAVAVGLGGHLATINDANEQKWVFDKFGSFAGKNRSLWIGLRDATGNGNFEWVDGQPLDYTHWLPGQPDNSPVTQGERFVHMLNTGNAYGHPGGYWNDLASPNNGFGTFDPLCGIVEVEPTLVPVLSIRGTPPEVCWSSQLHRRYQLQSTTHLENPVWVELGSPVPGKEGSTCFPDPLPAAFVESYYRVVVIP